MPAGLLAWVGAFVERHPGPGLREGSAATRRQVDGIQDGIGDPRIGGGGCLRLAR